MVALLSSFGIEAHADEARLAVTGGTPRRIGELPITHDHRILMASAILGLGARARGQESPLVLDPAVAAISDPFFFDQLRDLDGAHRD
jgi:5-enolpyruvylshikimate-3-phosphate synthase